MERRKGIIIRWILRIPRLEVIKRRFRDREMIRLQQQINELRDEIERRKQEERRFEDKFYLSNDFLTAGKKEEVIECHACDIEEEEEYEHEEIDEPEEGCLLEDMEDETTVIAIVEESSLKNTYEVEKDDLLIQIEREWDQIIAREEKVATMEDIEVKFNFDKCCYEDECVDNEVATKECPLKDIKESEGDDLLMQMTTVEKEWDDLISGETKASGKSEVKSDFGVYFDDNKNVEIEDFIAAINQFDEIKLGECKVKVNANFSNKSLLKNSGHEDVLVCEYDSLLGGMENESLDNGTNPVLGKRNQIAVMCCIEGIEIIKFHEEDMVERVGEIKLAIEGRGVKMKEDNVVKLQKLVNKEIIVDKEERWIQDKHRFYKYFCS